MRRLALVIFILLGGVLVAYLAMIDGMAALFAAIVLLLVAWFVQMNRWNFLLARIQENVQKLQKILQKWSSKNQKPD